MAFLFLPGSGFACDLCNVFLGMNPQFNLNQAGLRFRYRNTFGMHDHGILPSPDGHTHDHHATVTDQFMTLEAYGRFLIKPKWLTSVSVPFVMNRQISSGGNVSNYFGPGDPMVVVQRQIYDLGSCCDTIPLMHRLFAGAGIKAPLGYHRIDPDNEGIDPHLQPGTGSWDFLFVSSWMGRWKKFGLSIDVNYRLSTTNPDGFHFANRFNSTMNLFYSIQKKFITFMPNTGLYFETAGQDLQNGVYLGSSGGTALFGSAGMEVYASKLVLTASAQAPMVQHLNGTQPQNKFRLIGSVGWMF